MFCNAKCVAIYNALKDEVQTEDFINVWYEKKTIALPIVTGNEMEFHLYNAPLQIKIGQFGIKEPLNTRLVKQQDIDLMIVPGVAFDINGNRLGRGRGFYDKYLQYLKIPVIGLCFDFQLLDTIPAEPHDKKMTAIITEKRQIYFAI